MVILKPDSDYRKIFWGKASKIRQISYGELKRVGWEICLEAVDDANSMVYSFHKIDAPLYSQYSIPQDRIPNDIKIHYDTRNNRIQMIAKSSFIKSFRWVNL